MRPGPDVLAGVGLVRTAKETVPDGWPFFIVWEYGLEELLPYLGDPRDILEQGLQWQRIKGTPASIRMAHGWLQLTSTVEEETPTGRHWFEYQIDPGKVPSRSELVNLVGLARLSAPVGTRLSRVFHGYDLRRSIWDETAWSDGSLYSDHSGVYDPELGTDLSFGRTTISLYDLTGNIQSFAQPSTSTGSHARYNDRALWDHDIYDDEAPVRNYLSAINELNTVVGQSAVTWRLIADGSAIADGSLIADGSPWVAVFPSLGRTLHVADGVGLADGSIAASWGPRDDEPQYPATVATSNYTVDVYGWARFADWSPTRDWNSEIEEG
jgi:hypothetical protein